MKKMPILVIVPHGGVKIPEELSGYERLSEFDLLYESDACANEIFSLREEVSALIDTYVSRVFVDMDRSPYDLHPHTADGVVKMLTPTGKPVYVDEHFPDEIAIASLLKRYYMPYHETIDKVMRTGEIRLILECHTMMAVGPASAGDAGMPRPIISVQNAVTTESGLKSTSDDSLALELLDAMGREFSGEDSTVARRFSDNQPLFPGYILKKYGLGRVPMLRLSISRALFFNEQHFSYEYLKIDERRIEEIRGRILNGLGRYIKRTG